MQRSWGLCLPLHSTDGYNHFSQTPPCGNQWSFISPLISAHNLPQWLPNRLPHLAHPQPSPVLRNTNSSMVYTPQAWCTHLQAWCTHLQHGVHFQAWCTPPGQLQGSRGGESWVRLWFVSFSVFKECYHIALLCFFMFNLWSCVCVCVLMWVPVKARRGHQIPLGWD